MTINTFEVSPLGQKYVPLSLVKTVRELSSASTLESFSRRTKIIKSPYLRSDNVQKYSCFAAKRMVQKKNETLSSFPMAANIYKANSAEFKQRTKKSKKTALYSESRTSAIKACTVSDMSNSEYCDHKDNEKKRVKKRKTHQGRKSLLRHNTIDIYNRDGKELDCCNSIKIVSKRHGDVPSSNDRDYELEQDVWSALSNISKFQLNRSSEEVSSKRSSRRSKRKKEKGSTTAKLALPGTQLSIRNYRNRGKGTRLIETFRTEEMTVVANIEIEQHEESRTTLSPNSSYDRLTVISKEFLDKESRKADEIKIKDITINSTKTPAAAGRNQSTGVANNKQLSIKNNKGIAYSNNKQNTSIPMVVNTKPKRFQTSIQTNARNPTKVNLHSNLTNACFKENLNADAISLGESQHSSTHGSDDEFECFMDPTFKETKEDPRKNLQSNKNKIGHNNNPVAFGEANERFIIMKHFSNKPIPDKRLNKPAVKVIPKMTINEIRRKLNLIRYPLTILNNNQLSSTIKVMDVDLPQYYGLDKHIWPFMRDWMGNKTEKSENMHPVYVKTDSIANNFLNLIGKVSKISKNKNTAQENPRTLPVHDKKRNTMSQIKDKVMRIWQRAPIPQVENSDSIFNVNGNLRSLSPKVISNAKSEIPNTNKKAINENIKIFETAKTCKAALKENVSVTDNSKNLKPKENVKMTNAVRNNKALLTEFDESVDNIKSSKGIKNIAEMNSTLRNSAEVRENARSPEIPKELAEKHFRDRREGRHRDKMPAVLRYPWAKAKQASEFVENILVKIKKGVYSENESIAPNEKVANILDNINKGIYYGNESNLSTKEVSNVLDKSKKGVYYENVCNVLNEEVSNVLENIKKGVYYENECNASSAEVAKVLNKLKKGVYYDNEFNALNEVNHSSKKINLPPNKLVSPSNHENAQLIEFDCKDVSMQTLTWNNNQNDLCNPVKDGNNQSSPDCNPSEGELEPDVVIPGFEETLPQLEVETISCNQITVRHRTKNVTVQFDIAVPSKKSRCSAITNGTESSLISSNRSKTQVAPLTKKKNRSKTQVYKCNTAILNTALPAELCTMFPALLKNMFASGICLPETTMVDPLSIPGYETSGPSQRGKIQFKLQTPAYRLPWFASSKIPVCPPFIVSPALIEMSKGHYSSTAGQLVIDPLLTCSNVVDRSELLRRIVIGSLDIPQSRPIVQKLVYIVVDPLHFVMPEPNSADIEEPSQIMNTRFDEPSDRLESVVVQSSKIVDRFSPFYLYDQGCKVKETETISNGIVALLFTNAHDITWNYCKFNIAFTVPTFTVAQAQRLLGINFPSLSLFITNLSSISTIVEALPSFDDFNILDGIATISSSKGLVPLNFGHNCHENRLHQSVLGVLQKDFDVKEKMKNCDELTSSGYKKYNVRLEPSRGSHSSTQKKIVVGFRKFYKKCRSQFFSKRTSLDKISNVDDFIQTLGSARNLASVFNGICGVRLMTCVEEMKKWIKEISSKQALLVLMLMSKKDTPNMIRLRPLVLQGIALNRITRAKELEMEIEVLSQENLQITQSERLHNTSPELKTGCDLLEELFWIAKNTASDSQRPFDEKGIELFLKNLLQKRKNMNPSYLRVMARYVGLGLIKGQRKG